MFIKSNFMQKCYLKFDIPLTLPGLGGGKVTHRIIKAFAKWKRLEILPPNFGTFPKIYPGNFWRHF